MKFLLFFALFSLPLMAQDSIPTLEKMEPLSLRCVGKISHKATPLFMVDGKKYTKLRHKFKKLQPEDIAHIMIFYPERAKVFLVREQEMGRYMLSLKMLFRRQKHLPVILPIDNSTERSSIMQRFGKSIKYNNL